MKYLSIILGLLLLSAGRTSTLPKKSDQKMKTPADVTLTVLYDNYNFDKEFKSSWGFSCLIEGAGKTILFDTGGEDGNLMHNFRAAGKDPASVDLVILSHIHWDHTGGIPEFLDSRTGIDVYMPASFPDDFKELVKSKGARPVEITGSQELLDFVWTTGEMGDQIIEQSLVLETPGGLVIITGCSHPGIDKIVKKAVREHGDNVLLVIGGFHLLRTAASTVESIAREFHEMGIRYISPTHCSGDGTLEIFKTVFGENYIRSGAGKVIRTEDL
jgi:7,8-dihydropterin-6-yl-methyl-4-(beta-D-ribofuranosyl)aminobenzene 5'-phosphate synthase